LNISINNFILTIFGTVIIENGGIVRATNKYHNTSWFSDISIKMNSEELYDYMTDDGICYGKVIIII
jgi:hypothetical protein